jgi:hypothetical protein
MNRSIIQYINEETKPLTPNQSKLLRMLDWSKLNPFKSPKAPNTKNIKLKPKLKKD